MEYIYEMVGFLLIWFSVDYKRKEESKIDFLSKDWFIVLVVITIGVILIERF